MTPWPNTKGTRSTRFLVTSQGDAHPSWSQMLTPKVKPSFRLNFVEDILAIGCMLKLVLRFHSSKKIFGIWSCPEIGKTTAFGGLGEPPVCSLITESVRFRQQSGRFKMQATAERVFISKF
jgi:hypothetical protein